MSRRFCGFMVAAVFALPLGISARQADQPKTLTASVTVTTSDDRRNVAVLSKGGASDQPVFLFCIDVAVPIPNKIEFTGPARVVYRPLPLGDIPKGVKISGPENVSSALAVLPTGGKGWLFLGKNEKTVVASGDPAAAGVTSVGASTVRRLDWVAGNGQRRGMDVEPCFTAGG